MEEIKAKEGVHGTQLTTLSLPNAAALGRESYKSVNFVNI